MGRRTVSIPTALLDKLRKRCAADGRSMSGVVVDLVCDFLGEPRPPSTCDGARYFGGVKVACAKQPRHGFAPHEGEHPTAGLVRWDRRNRLVSPLPPPVPSKARAIITTPAGPRVVRLPAPLPAFSREPGRMAPREVASPPVPRLAHDEGAPPDVARNLRRDGHTVLL